MSTTATHDTKRGEDARIRIAMLSEMPRRWGQSVSRWMRFNRSRHTEIDGEIVPDRNVEYLFYQTLVGAWPPGMAPSDVAEVGALAERIGAYMTKAVREGKEESSWSNPNASYEAALERFVANVLDASRPNVFLADFHAFIESMSRFSAIASLAQLTIKLTAPGLPDIYQGCELWDFSLVDPDNRRSPDWQKRRALLAAVAGDDPSSLGETSQDGREKLFVASRLLSLRQQHPALFAEGDCRCTARVAAATIIFARLPVATRKPPSSSRCRASSIAFATNGDAGWGATALPLPRGGRWCDVLSGRVYEDCARIAANTLFAD